MGYKRFENETEEELIYRVGSDKYKIGTWDDVAKILNLLLGYDYGESTYRKRFQAFEKMFNVLRDKFLNDDNYVKELQEKEREIKKERIKLQTEKLEYHRWLREEARDELISEHLVQAIEKIEPLKIPKAIPIIPNGRDYALCYGDCHDGAEFCIKGLFGEIIAEYNPEIFEERMWKLLASVKKIVEDNDINLLKVYDFSDSIDGMLRVGQLSKLRWGVVDQTIHYAEFISNWLEALTEFVNVDFQMVIDGNHSQLRMLGQPKNSFKEDNMSKIIAFHIKNRTENNPNFNMKENPTGMIFDKIAEYGILGIHGESKNMEKTFRHLSKTYNVDINYLIGGHLHHNKQEEIGFDAEVINIGSIIGVDDYSLSIEKTSNSSAKLIGFEEEKGKFVEYTIKLN